MKRLAASVKLRCEIAADYERLSRRAAWFILRELKRRPDLLLCASAGGTPTRAYELLGRHARRRPYLFRRMRVLQIDEWCGVPHGNPASCETDLARKLLEPLRLDRKRYTGFRSDAADPEGECRRIAGWLARNGPIDICILGLGTNGHVALNEPGDALVPHVHVAKLTRSSQQHPMLKELRRKPRYGLTLGLADILSSRKLLLLVNGKHKRAAVQRLLKPNVTTRFPGSLLWLHPDATVLCDRGAAPLT